MGEQAERRGEEEKGRWPDTQPKWSHGENLEASPQPGVTERTRLVPIQGSLLGIKAAAIGELSLQLKISR